MTRFYVFIEKAWAGKDGKNGKVLYFLVYGWRLLGSLNSSRQLRNPKVKYNSDKWKDDVDKVK